jgi:general L-amino acid transport system permease protein
MAHALQLPSLQELRSEESRGTLIVGLVAGLLTFVFGQQVITLLGPGSKFSPSLISTYGIGFGIPRIAAFPLSVVLALSMALFVFIRLSELNKGRFNPSETGKKMQKLMVIAALPFVFYSIFQLAFLIENDKSWYFGTEFLWEQVGFDIRNPWPYESDLASSRSKYFIIGIISAVRVVLISIVLCTIIGIFAGVMRLSRNKVVSTLATVYVEFFRNLPLVVQLFFWYAGVLLALPMITDNIVTAGGWLHFSSQGVMLPGIDVQDMALLYLVIVMPLSVRVVMRFITRSKPRKDPSGIVENTEGPIGPLLAIIKRPFSFAGWRGEALLADLLFIACTLLFIYLVDGFWTYGPIMFILGLFVFLYSIYITFNLNNIGLNDFEIDETTEGVRKRSAIWISTLLVTLFLLNQAITPAQPELIKEGAGWASWYYSQGMQVTHQFFGLMIGLTIYTSVQVAEIVRGSIQSLPRGQIEAAISQGLSPFQRLRLVILPQALRSMIPAMTNQYLNCWKNSSLALVIGYSDFFAVSMTLVNNTGQAVPIFLMILVTYQCGSLLISAIMNTLNAQVTKVKI